MGIVPGRQDRGPRSRSSPRERPGCVTLYALLTILGALFSIVGAFAMAALYARGRTMFEQALQQQGMGLLDLDQLTPYLGAALVISLLSAVVNLAIGIGLWMLKNWARLAVVVLSTLGFVSGLVQLVRTSDTFREAGAGTAFTGLPLPIIGGMLVAFAIQAVIIFWFLVNRDLFD